MTVVILTGVLLLGVFNEVCIKSAAALFAEARAPATDGICQAEYQQQIFNHGRQLFNWNE